MEDKRIVITIMARDEHKGKFKSELSYISLGEALRALIEKGFGTLISIHVKVE